MNLPPVQPLQPRKQRAEIAGREKAIAARFQQLTRALDKFKWLWQVLDGVPQTNPVETLLDLHFEQIAFTGIEASAFCMGYACGKNIEAN